MSRKSPRRAASSFLRWDEGFADMNSLGGRANRVRFTDNSGLARRGPVPLSGFQRGRPDRRLWSASPSPRTAPSPRLRTGRPLRSPAPSPRIPELHQNPGCCQTAQPGFSLLRHALVRAGTPPSSPCSLVAVQLETSKRGRACSAPPRRQGADVPLAIYMARCRRRRVHLARSEICQRTGLVKEPPDIGHRLGVRVGGHSLCLRPRVLHRPRRSSAGTAFRFSNTVGIVGRSYAAVTSR